MLKLTEPIKLKTGRDILPREDVMGRRIMSDYNLFGAEINAEELYFLLAGTPEEQAARESVVNNGFISSNNVNTALSIELVNNFINRISQPENEFTYNDSVFITEFLTKAGVSDVNEFVTRIKQIQNNAESIQAIAQTSEEIKNTLNSAVNETNIRINTEIKSSEERQSVRSERLLTLHDRIFGRLMTRELSAIVHNHAVSPAESSHTVTNAEIRTAEQLFTMQKQTVSELERDISEVSRIFLEKTSEEQPPAAEPRKRRRNKAEKSAAPAPKKPSAPVLPIANYIESIAKNADIYQSIKNYSEAELNSLKSYLSENVTNVGGSSETHNSRTEQLIKSYTDNRRFTENRTASTSAPKAAMAQKALFTAVENAIYSRLIHNGGDSVKNVEMNYAVSSAVTNLTENGGASFSADNSVEYYLNNPETVIAQAVLTQLSQSLGDVNKITQSRTESHTENNAHTTIMGENVENRTEIGGVQTSELYFKNNENTQINSYAENIRNMLSSSLTALEQRFGGNTERLTSIHAENVENKFSSVKTTFLNSELNEMSTNVSDSFNRTEITREGDKSTRSDARTSVSETNVSASYNAPHSEFSRTEQSHVSVSQNSAETIEQLVRNDINNMLKRTENSYTDGGTENSYTGTVLNGGESFTQNSETSISQADITYKDGDSVSSQNEQIMNTLNAITQNNLEAAKTQEKISAEVRAALPKGVDMKRTMQDTLRFMTQPREKAEEMLRMESVPHKPADITNILVENGDTVTKTVINALNELEANPQKAAAEGLIRKGSPSELTRELKAIEKPFAPVSLDRPQTAPQAAVPAESESVHYDESRPQSERVIRETVFEDAPQDVPLRRSEPFKPTNESRRMERLVTPADIKQPQNSPTEREIIERAERRALYEENREKTERRVHEQNIYKDMPAVPIVYKKNSTEEQVSQTSEKLTRGEVKTTEVQQNETRHEKIEQNIINNRDITQNIADSERIEGMVKNAVEGSISRITDKVYSNIERRLKSERSRRGF